MWSVGPPFSRLFVPSYIPAARHICIIMPDVCAITSEGADISYSSSRRIVVTGASGFIGRHLVSKCIADGFQVIALSRKGIGSSGATDVRIDDYRNAKEIAPLCRGADAVIHLAARAHQVNEDAQSAAALYDAANVDSALAVAVASRLAGAKRFVLVSSIGVNGNATHGIPFNSADEPKPVDTYAKSKWKAEQAVAAELRAGPTDFVILRPPLVYGDDCPGNFATLLRLIARAPIVPLGKVRTGRTFVYVENLVDAIVTAAQHPAASRRTFLVADAQSLALCDVVRILASGLNRSPRIVVNVPVALLKLVARLAGRADTLNKLTAELLVDANAFGASTGWVAPVAAEHGLHETAGAYRRNRTG
jgi:nucleoside-diphosphate-sugar epimerase